MSGALGLVAAALLYLLSGWAAERLGNPQAEHPLRVLSFALPFIAVGTSLSGYLTARRRMPAVGVLQIVEQLLRVGITIGALRILPGDDAYAILALAMGMTSANALSFALTFAFCLLDLRKADPAPAEKGLFTKIRRIALPDAAGSWIRSGLSTTEQLLVPKRLAMASAQENPLATYGLIQGMAMPVLSLPSAPVQALAGLLIPELSRMRILGHGRTIQRTVRRALLLALCYSAAVALCVFLGADVIANGLYQNGEAASFIRWIAPLALFQYTDMLVDQMLKGLDQQVFCMRLNTVDCVLRVLMVLFLLPLGGAKAYILMLYVSAAFNSSLSLLRLLRVSRQGRA